MAMKLSSSTENKNKRLFFVGAFFAVGFGVLVSRAVSFHLKDNEQLEAVALRQYRTAVHQSTRRGKILDAVGRELAVNIQVESIYANPGAIGDPATTAKKLAGILGEDAKKLAGRLRSQRKFVWVKRQVSDREAEKVSALNLLGIHSMKESQRAYPSGMLASSVLGAVGFDAKGLAGIEFAFDDLLISHARPGEYRRDARGHLYLSPTDVEEEELTQIELTIDKSLQYIAERELQQGIESASARGGVAIVLDPMSGKVLAMASSPSFDPNHYSRYEPALWKNRTLTDAYEPGSTLKAMVIAAALERGVVTPETIFDCHEGEYVIGPKTIRDSKPHGKLSVSEVLQVSSNIGAAQIGLHLSSQDLAHALAAFGFGRPTNIGLPGEASGIVPRPESWSELQHATISFGQGISATPLQMAMAFAAIANGGELLRPRVVKRIVDGEGNEIGSPRREVVGRPLRPETARLLVRLLERATQTGGSGTLAASSEYPVAGKTGTAQKVDEISGGYADGRYYSSFIGFAPSDEPRLVVLVGIDEPRGGLYYGGQVAAPVFRRIVEASLHYMKVPARTRLPFATTPVEMPKSEEQIFLGREAPRVVKMQGGRWRVPDFRGLTMRGVLEALGTADIALQVSGSGIAKQQTPPPGSVLSSGATCRVFFEPLM